MKELCRLSAIDYYANKLRMKPSIDVLGNIQINVGVETNSLDVSIVQYCNVWFHVTK